MTKKQKRERKKILIAGGIFVLLALIEHLGVLPAVFDNRLLKLLCYLIPYLVVGRDVVKGAVHGVLSANPFDEAFLMTLATFGAFAVGEDTEAVAVMLFYSVGELFQDVAVGKSRKSIKALMEIAPEYANLLLEDGSTKTVDPSELKIGDTIVIKAGEKVPVDGIVTDGTSMIDTKAITGESVPRSVRKDEAIISGCINGEGLLRVRVEKAYEDSTVAKILDMVENASEKKSRTENFITRFARYYTPVVVIGALILAVVPPIVTGTGFMMWIQRACTFLVISCPCALVLSVPLSFFGGIGAASRQGVLVKGSNYLEALGEMETLVSDKTGTLTKGEFRVTSILPASGEKTGEKAEQSAANKDALLETAAYAESFSDHPIALSILEAYGRKPDTAKVTDTMNVSGQGIIAQVDGHTVLAGNDKLMQENKIAFTETDQAGTVVYIAEDGTYRGCIVISDVIKDEAKQAIAALKAAGVKRTVMLTGDRKEAADAVGKELGMDLVCSELLPADKVGKVEALQQEMSGHGKLAFVGDGINDAPVLARADIGIAMGSMGSDAAIEAADVVIMDDDLMRIPGVIRVARKTLRIARENIVFALGVKLVVLALGALGLANMWAAVFADVGVSVICILNSMRMLRAK
ncbi:MAG: heavy metal translocating P-type ATPase [Eubacteriales bacterium]|nr:heavy metal translocating P-type ATPase [Eubacteriales bacterium]